MLTTIVAFLLLSKLYQFQTDEHFTAIRKGSVVELLLAGIPIAFVYYWTDLLFHRAID